MKSLVVSRLSLILLAPLSLLLLGIAVTAGWVVGYNRATEQLAAERLGFAISLWESLNTPSVDGARELLEIEISSAATELFTFRGQPTTKHLAAYRDRLRVIAEKIHDAELRQTLLALLGTKQ